MKVSKRIRISYEDTLCYIPYHVYDSGIPGKHIVIISGVHGDEINGIKIISDFMQWFDQTVGSSFSGKITCVPIVNVLGYQKGKRRIPIDNSDLNRSFLLDEPKTFSAFYAQTLWKKIFVHADAVIDLHDAGERDVLSPHSRFFVENTESVYMAELLDTNIAIQRKGKKGMLAKYLQKHAIPTLTIEVGGNKEFDILGQKLIRKGLIRILHYYGCLSDEYALPKRNTMCVYTKRCGFKATQRCLVEVKKNLSDLVVKGDEIATVFDPLTQEKYILYSPVNGIVFSVWRANSIYAGAKIISLLVSDDIDIPEDNKELTTELSEFTSMLM